MQENTTKHTRFLVKKSKKSSKNKKFQNTQKQQNIKNFVVNTFHISCIFHKKTHKALDSLQQIQTLYNNIDNNNNKFLQTCNNLEKSSNSLTNFLSKLAKWQQKTHNVNTKHKIVCVVVDERKHFSHTHSYTTTFVSFLRHISWQNPFSTKILVNLSQITTTFLQVFFLFYIFVVICDNTIQFIKQSCEKTHQSQHFTTKHTLFLYKSTFFLSILLFFSKTALFTTHFFFHSQQPQKQLFSCTKPSSPQTKHIPHKAKKHIFHILFNLVPFFKLGFWPKLISSSSSS